MKEIEVRPATAADVPALADLMTELGYPTTVDQMTIRLGPIFRRDDFATFVATADGTAVGMIGVTVAPSYEHDTPTGRIVGLVVAEAFRGLGIGARLVRAGEDWLVGRAADRVSVTSGMHRSLAHEFYERLGYDRTGFRFVRSLIGRPSPAPAKT